MINAHSQHKKSRKRRGQTLIEFALVLPILIVVLLGIIEFGWLISRTYTVGNATREGARYAALGKTFAETKTRVQQSATSVSIPTADITLEYFNGSWQAWPADNNSTGKNGVPVDSQMRVTVSTAHRSLTGFFGFLKNRNITQSTVMRREL